MNLIGAIALATSVAAFGFTHRQLCQKTLVLRFDFEPTFSIPIGFPAMVGVRVGGYGHFIAVLDVRGDGVTYVDPLSGKARLPVSEFLRRYEFTGFQMIVSKN